MKVTVTVELDEGVKASSSSYVDTYVTMEKYDGSVNRATMEAILVEQMIPEFAENIKEMFNIEPKLRDLAVTHAELAIGKVLSYFDKHKCMLLQRTKNGVREVHQVGDVDVALKWLADGDA